jgi:hypothetical protein
MKRVLVTLVPGIAMGIALLAAPAPASAFSINHGSKIVTKDGGGDHNVNIRFSGSGGGNFEQGYFLNGGSHFQSVHDNDVKTFHDGDEVDLALYDRSTGKIHSLSNEGHDNDFHASMNFDERPDRHDGDVSWHFDKDDHHTNIHFEDGKDCAIPTHGVPEPGSLVLLGMGLTGIALLQWRRARGASSTI